MREAEWWRTDAHPDAAEHRKFIEKSAKEDAERFLSTVPVKRKALPPPRPRKKAAASRENALVEHLGQLTAKAIKDAVAPLEARIAELEASPTKYVGVWTQGTEFQARSIVSYDGSMWHANETTKEKPGTGPTWTLCVKRGQNGKDAKP